MVSSREFALYFFFLLIFFLAFYRRVRLRLSSSDHAMHGVQGKDAYNLTPRRPFKCSDDGEF